MTDATVYIAQSLDGYIADAEGSIAWLRPFEVWDYGYDAFWARIDAVVMGSTTYRDCRRFPEWPYRGKAVFVMTRSGRLDEDGLAVFDDRSAVEIALDLERAGLGRIWVAGGGRPIRAFLDAGLVRRLRIFQIPVLLGAGTPLWVAGKRRLSARPIATTVHGNGVVETHWEIVAPAGTADDSPWTRV
ncbi:MAG: dihydrofolate reductase family protein [Siculibacillus sp.]|nr:dihydrofolate reductase family protein [Siculibacillus sp.]